MKPKSKEMNNGILNNNLIDNCKNIPKYYETKCLYAFYKEENEIQMKYV